MVERVWKEAQRLIEKERPESVAELGKVERDLARAEEQLEKYFLAFEDGTMARCLRSTHLLLDWTAALARRCPHLLVDPRPRAL